MPGALPPSLFVSRYAHHSVNRTLCPLWNRVPHPSDPLQVLSSYSLLPLSWQSPLLSTSLPFLTTPNSAFSFLLSSLDVVSPLFFGLYLFLLPVVLCTHVHMYNHVYIALQL